jgi:hypothetical protein
MSKYGFVYILQSSAMPGVYKVGMTERSPHQRAIELSQGTGIPVAYEVAFYGETHRAAIWERHVHRELAQYRVSDSREFFKVPLAAIIKSIEGDGELLSSWDSDMAREARNPGHVDKFNPLWFEQNLHEAGYLERVRRSAR